MIKEIVGLLETMRDEYNSGGFDFTRSHTLPLMVIEDSNCTMVEDQDVFDRIFEVVIMCNKYLDLPTTEFRLQHFLRISETVVTTKVIWEFSSVQKKVEVVLEVGYIMQKKDKGWMVVAILQPLWRDPFTSVKDITKLRELKEV
jgi:hypothetical protein